MHRQQCEYLSFLTWVLFFLSDQRPIEQVPFHPAARSSPRTYTSNWHAPSQPLQTLSIGAPFFFLNSFSFFFRKFSHGRFKRGSAVQHTLVVYSRIRKKGFFFLNTPSCYQLPKSEYMAEDSPRFQFYAMEHLPVPRQSSPPVFAHRYSWL